MDADRSATYRVVLPSGLIVERLPLGFAAGQWWLTVVISGLGSWLEEWLRPGTFHDPVSSTVRLAGPNGPFNGTTTSGGGGDYRYGVGDVFHGLMQFGPIEWVDVAYKHEGELVMAEHLDLSAR